MLKRELTYGLDCPKSQTRTTFSAFQASATRNTNSYTLSRPIYLPLSHTPHALTLTNARGSARVSKELLLAFASFCPTSFSSPYLSHSHLDTMPLSLSHTLSHFNSRTQTHSSISHILTSTFSVFISTICDASTQRRRRWYWTKALRHKFSPPSKIKFAKLDIRLKMASLQPRTHFAKLCLFLLDGCDRVVLAFSQNGNRVPPSPLNSFHESTLSIFIIRRILGLANTEMCLSLCSHNVHVWVTALLISAYVTISRLDPSNVVCIQRVLLSRFYLYFISL